MSVWVGSEWTRSGLIGFGSVRIGLCLGLGVLGRVRSARVLRAVSRASRVCPENCARTQNRTYAVKTEELTDEIESGSYRATWLIGRPSLR